MPLHQLQPAGKQEVDEEAVCLFAQTNFRNQMRRFGIKTDDRRRHMYVIGKTGMGKTTLMENMVLQDIYKGNGIGVVDPHGDFAEKILNFIPPHRINDVVYFNPADVGFPIGFNILEVKSEEQKHLVAAGLMAVFKKIWPDVWSSRMEYILNNTLLALLDYPGSTLLGINRLLGDKKYRKKVVKKLTDPVIRGFWQNEFANYEPRYQKEAVAPIQNKIGQFLSASVIRNMVAQVKSTIDVRDIMDNRKILIMNLSKGRIGEDNSRLLGGMLITQIQLAAMARVDTPEAERQDFFLYVDEFQNFATPSFANILSEARKYRLSLILAHQYVAQLDEVVADAVFGNVGSMLTFRVGGGDAEMLVKEFTPTFIEEDIVNLPKFQIFLKLMIDGVASQPFSASTMPPIGSPTGSMEKVVRVSRERYGRERAVIEEKILRWSGMEGDDEGDTNMDKDGNIDTTAKRKDKDKDADSKKKSTTSEKRKPSSSSNERKDQGVGKKKEAPKQKIKDEAPERKKDMPKKQAEIHTSEKKQETVKPSVSLSDLMPPAPKGTSVSAPALEPKGGSVSEKKEGVEESIVPQSEKRKDSSVAEKKVVSETRVEEKGERAGDGGGEKKKRRKRNKNKNKSDRGGEGGGSDNRFRASASQSQALGPQVNAERDTSSEKKVSPKDESAQKSIDPDTVVRFD